MIVIRGLTKKYGSVTALSGVDLAVTQGEIFGLLGPNGAGKSTLMHIMAGLFTADGGSIELAGLSAPQPQERARLLGLVPQEIALYPELTAWANLELFGRLYGLSRKDWQQRAEELLELVNLMERRHEKVKTYSGGMKRRLNLAASLLHRPQCLLCDEPTVGVDPQSRNAIFEFLEAQNRVGLTLVYTTHYLEEVERLCHRIGIIDNGVVKACGTREELLSGARMAGEIRIYPGVGLAGLLASLAALGSVADANGYHRFTPAGDYSLTDLLQCVEQSGFPHGNIEVRRPTLEQCFLQITGKEMRE